MFWAYPSTNPVKRIYTAIKEAIINPKSDPVLRYETGGEMVIADLLTQLAELYPEFNLSDRVLSFYIPRLESIGFLKLRRILQEWISERKHFPSVNELLKIAGEQCTVAELLELADKESIVAELLKNAGEQK